jgi:ABC transport system ATP-binding/permease protein
MEEQPTVSSQRQLQLLFQKKAEREEVERTETAKAGQLLKKELEWMRRQPKARTTKSNRALMLFMIPKRKPSQQTGFWN